MAKLTDRQRKQIIAEYANGDISQRELAERYQVTQKTISKILSTEEVRQKVSDKKEENTRSMLEFLDEQKSTAQSLMQKLLKASEEDIEKASLRDKMGALKILSEVFAPHKNDGKSGEENGGMKVEFVFKDTSMNDESDRNT